MTSYTQTKIARKAGLIDFAPLPRMRVDIKERPDIELFASPGQLINPAKFIKRYDRKIRRERLLTLRKEGKI